MAAELADEDEVVVAAEQHPAGRGGERLGGFGRERDGADLADLGVGSSPLV